MRTTKTNGKDLLMLHAILLIYSLGQIASKTAARVSEADGIWNLPFIFYMGLVFLSLGIYAILWQQVIKRMPLTTAYSNKAVTIVWGMLWGAIFFNEVITIFNIIGGLIIFAGVYLVVSDNE